MKRTVDVNLNGIHYVIDEDAYTLLEQYLNDIERHFSKEEERDVVTDIEARIAELFSESMVHGRNVVDIETTRQALDRIGRPEQMDEDNGESYDKDSTHYNKSEKNSFAEAADDIKNKGEEIFGKIRNAKLYRDTDDVMVSGVCSGIAHRTNVEVWIIRLAVALGALLTHGTVAIIYIVMWVLIPKAISVAQKLEMRGKQADLASIQNFKSETTSKTDAQYVFGNLVKVGLLFLLCSFIFAGCNALNLAGWFSWSPLYLPLGDYMNISYYSHNTWHVIDGICSAIAVLLPLIVAAVWLSRHIFDNPYRPFRPATKTTLWAIWIVAMLLIIIARTI